MRFSQLLAAFRAILDGAALCCSDKLCRRYALLPILSATVAYVLFLPIAFSFQSDLIESLLQFVPKAIESVAYPLLWLVTALSLLGVVLLVVMIVSAILSGYFQTLLAARVLFLFGYTIPDDDTSALGILSEVKRCVAVEMKKLFWIIPLSFIAFMLSMIPMLAPISFPIGAWVISYQYFDYPLEALKLPSGARRKLFWRWAPALTVFGMTLVFCAAVPFAMILIPPFAAAGVARLSAKGGWMREVS